MKLKSSIFILFSMSQAFAGVQTVDSKVAECGAAVSIVKSEGKTLLTINNQNCGEVAINLPGLEMRERLTRGATANFDISKISGSKLPVSIDGKFLTLELQNSSGNIQTQVVVGQTEEQKRLTQLQIQEAKRKQARENAENAAAVGVVGAIGAAAVANEVSKGEH